MTTVVGNGKEKQTGNKKQQKITPEALKTPISNSIEDLHNKRKF